MSAKKKVKPIIRDFKFWSEETCKSCLEVFDTMDILTVCPDCGKTVVSCTACDNLACGKCVIGNNWNQYGISREVPVEEIEVEIPWFEGGTA